MFLIKSIIYFLSIFLVTTTSLLSQGKTYCLDFDNLKFDSFNELNKDIKGKKLVVLGERHYLKANYILQPE